MGAISPLHLVIVAVVALIVIGPARLPETGAALGRALREFREAQRDDPPPPSDPAA
jgi:sec-independent protein translocase protein TatA